MPRPGIAFRRAMMALTILTVASFLWACRFAGLDQEDATSLFLTGSCLGLPALGIFVLLVLAMHASPGDRPPPDSKATGRPQFTIGSLLWAILIASVALAVAYSNRR